MPTTHLDSIETGYMDRPTYKAQAERKVKLECGDCRHAFRVSELRLAEERNPDRIVTCPKCGSADLTMFV